MRSLSSPSNPYSCEASCEPAFPPPSAGIELLSWRSARESVVGVQGLAWRVVRLAVWYIWRVYVLLCGEIILFLHACECYIDWPFEVP